MKNKYFIVHDWMVLELGLKGIERDVYAIIYGFSQDEESKFNGSRQYLADLIGCGLTSISNALDNLVDKGLIIKEDKILNGINIPTYHYKKCIPPTKFEHPPTKFEHNNIDNIKENNKNISKDILEKPKKKTRYEQCLDEINKRYEGELVESLKLYLPLVCNDLKGFNQWLGMLNKLDGLNGDKVAIVKKATEKGWKSFYEINNTYVKYPERDGQTRTEVSQGDILNERF